MAIEFRFDRGSEYPIKFVEYITTFDLGFFVAGLPKVRGLSEKDLEKRISLVQIYDKSPWYTQSPTTVTDYSIILMGMYGLGFEISNKLFKEEGLRAFWYHTETGERIPGRVFPL